MRKKLSANGHALLTAFDDLVAEHSARANARAESVDARITELEDELHALQTLQARLRSAVKA